MNKNLVVLVDEKNKVLGTEEKMAAHEKGLLHRAFSVFVFNSKGELLLQKRDSGKYHCGGLWSNTVCSHPHPNERFLAGAHRRLKEEMGFDCPLKKVDCFIYNVSFENGLTEHEYDCVFKGNYDGKIKPNPEEVEEYKWVSMDWLREDVLKNSNDYTFWFKKIILEQMI